MPTSLPFNDRSEERARALIALAAELGTRGARAGMNRRRSAAIALQCLAAFARKQFDFLRNGLQAGGAFEGDPRYPFTFLHEATARQVSFDIDVLLRAAGHRNAATATQSMCDTLDVADRLATQAILPAVRHGLAEPTVMLTYFQKLPTIRLMPYVPLAVIGIDFSATGDPTRLLAIAHETGHHVYRQITVNYTAHLDAQIEAMATPAPARWPLWLLAWEEEIFADIYATLIAGPAAAVGLQQLILTNHRTGLITDDGDHPLDALRPLIMHTVLRAMAAHRAAEASAALLAATDALTEAWQQQLAARGTAREFIPAGETAPVTLVEAGEQLAALVEEMVGGVLRPLLTDGAHQLWSSGGAAAGQILAQSSAHFAALAQERTGEPLPELMLRNEARTVRVTRFAHKATGGQRTVGEIGDAYLDGLRNAGLNGASLTATEWKAVFLAGDWTTEEGGSGIKPPVFRPAYWWLQPAPTAPRPVRRR